MDALANKQRRNSRWSSDPVIGGDGKPVAVYPTERDIEIFRLLVRFRYLPGDYIHAFVGGNEKALSRRLNLLSRKPNLYLARPHQQRQNADANYRRLIYQLDDRGSPEAVGPASRLRRRHTDAPAAALPDRSRAWRMVFATVEECPSLLPMRPFSLPLSWWKSVTWG